MNVTPHVMARVYAIACARYLRETEQHRHPGAGRDPRQAETEFAAMNVHRSVQRNNDVTRCSVSWVPAYAGMTWLGWGSGRQDIRRALGSDVWFGTSPAEVT